MLSLLSSKIKLGKKFMQITGWYIVVMSILWVSATDIVFVSDFQGYTGSSFADYKMNAPSFANIYIITKKLVGLMSFASGVLTLFITHNSYSQGEKWSWYALLSVAIIIWGSLIGYRVYIGYVAPSMITFILGFALNLAGLIIPASEFL
jgi:hypothetical protein